MYHQPVIFGHLLHEALPFSILLERKEPFFRFSWGFIGASSLLANHVLLCGTVISIHALSLLLEARIHAWHDYTAFSGRDARKLKP